MAFSLSRGAFIFKVGFVKVATYGCTVLLTKIKTWSHYHLVLCAVYKINPFRVPLHVLLKEVLKLKGTVLACQPTVGLIPVGPQGLIGYGTLLRSRVRQLKAPPPLSTNNHFFYRYLYTSGERFFTTRHFNWIYSRVQYMFASTTWGFLKYCTKSIRKKKGCTKERNPLWN
jgi:hypothetical protein